MKTWIQNMSNTTAQLIVLRKQQYDNPSIFSSSILKCRLGNLIGSNCVHYKTISFWICSIPMKHLHCFLLIYVIVATSWILVDSYNPFTHYPYCQGCLQTWDECMKSTHTSAHQWIIKRQQCVYWFRCAVPRYDVDALLRKKDKVLYVM